MKPVEVEYKTLQIVERQRAGQPLEDSLVELKREWPTDHKRAAERIAGHANASHGEPVLWLIGLDEKDGVVGANERELANWWPQVQKHFDGISPELGCHINVADDATGKTVVALEILTDRPPYVVNGGDGKRIVPWRSGTRTDGATRAQLLRILFPLQKLPLIEVIEQSLLPTGGNGIRFLIHLFLTPNQGFAESSVIYLPKHKMIAKAHAGGVEYLGTVGDIHFRGAHRFQSTSQDELPQVTVDSAGKLQLEFRFKDINSPNLVSSITYSLGIAGEDDQAITGEYLHRPKG